MYYIIHGWLNPQMQNSIYRGLIVKLVMDFLPVQVITFTLIFLKLHYTISDVESRKARFIETKSSLVIARGWELGKWRDVAQMVQTSSFKME